MMKKLIFTLIFLGILSHSAFSYWIWTPQTGKWLNPKYAVKDTPQEQLEYSVSLFETDEIKKALNEFRKLIRYFPRTFEASESQYYIGRCYEKLNNLYEAYLAYQKTLEKYPFTKRTTEIVELEFNIGEKFLEEKKGMFLGLEYPLQHRAIEVFKSVVTNAPYSKFAPLAQYKMGLAYLKLDMLFEARDAFEKVVSNYPDSEWVEAAEFQLATSTYRMSLDSDYDQGARQEAKEKLESFIEEHPDTVLVKQAEKRISDLEDKDAESNFNVAKFYERQKSYESARIYYKYVIKTYPYSDWADKAAKRIEALENQ